MEIFSSRKEALLPAEQDQASVSQEEFGKGQVKQTFRDELSLPRSVIMGNLA